MIPCEQCGAEVAEGRCENGHSTDVVVPAGTVAPANGSSIRLATETQRVTSSGVLAEAFGALDELSETASPGEPPAPSPPAQDRVATEAPDLQPAMDPVDHEPEMDPDPAEPTAGPAAPARLEADVDDGAVFLAGSAEAPPEAPAEASRAAAENPGAEWTTTPELIGKPLARARRPRRFLMVPLILALLAGAGGFVLLGGTAAEAAVYRRVFVEGERHRYRFTLSMEGTVHAGPMDQPMRMTMDMALAEHTLAVDAQGVGTIRQTIEALDVAVDGDAMPVPDLAGASLTVRVAPDGRVLSMEGLGGLGFAQAGPAGELLGPNSFVPLLSSDRVAPGDTWTVEEEVPNPFDQPLRVTARNRLVKLGVEGGVETALIRSSLEMPMDMRVAMADLLRMAEEATGERMPGGDLMPADAVFVYSGGMSMEILQTVAVASGRPLTVSGSGDVDLGIRVEGVPGMPEMRMRMTINASMAEVGAGARETRAGRNGAPILSA